MHTNDIAEQDARLDDINEFKQKMQDSMPVVKLMQIKCGPTSLLGLERNQNLRIMGYTNKQIARMCLPDKIDMDEVLERVAEEQKRELRRLRKLDFNRKNDRNSKQSDPFSILEIEAVNIDQN